METKKVKVKKTNVVKKVSIDGNEINRIINEALPEILKEKFKSNYSNPLADVLDDVLKDDSVKEEIKDIVISSIKEIKKTHKFKELIRESLIGKVIDDLRKFNN